MHPNHTYRKYSIAAFLLLLPFLLLAFFVWPSSDDFAMSVLMAQHELSASGIGWLLYHEWGGRYSTLLGAQLSPLVTEHLWLYRLLVAATLVLLAVSVRWCWKGLLAGVAHKSMYSLAAGAFLLIWFQVMPGTADSLYWYSGMVVYTWPLILFFFMAGGLLRESASLPLKILLVPTAFLLVGFNEMAAVLTVLLVAAWWLISGKKKDRWLKISLLVALTAGLLLLLLSPGNAKRMALFANNSNLWDALYISLVSLAKLNAIHLQSITVWLMVLLVFPWLHLIRWSAGWSGQGTPELPRWLVRLGKHPVGVFVAGQAILWGLLFIPAWSMGINPPLRVYNFLSPFWLLWLVGLLVAVRHHSGEKAVKGWPVFHGRGLKIMALLMALSLMVNFVKIPGGEVVFGGNVPRAWHDLAFRAAPYNRAMHLREALIHEALQQGETTLTVPSLHNPPGTIHFLDIFPDGEHWINRLVGEYYGVERLETRE